MGHWHFHGADLADEEMKAIDPRVIRRLLAYVFPYKVQFLTGVGLMILATGAGLLGPWLIRAAVDNYILAGDMGGLTLISATYATLHLVSWFANYWRELLIAQVGQSVIFDLRRDLFAKLQQLTFSYFDGVPAGVLISRVVNDVGVIFGPQTDVVLVVLNQGADYEPGTAAITRIGRIVYDWHNP